MRVVFSRGNELFPIFILILISLIYYFTTMTKIEIKFQSESPKGFSYTNQDIDVVLTLDRKLPVADSYRLKIYNDQLMLVSIGDTACSSTTRRGRKSYSLSMRPIKVWMPGHYFILMTNSEDFIQRFELYIDENLGIKVSEGRQCAKFSFEHILHESFQSGLWGLICALPGTSDILKWIYTHVGKRIACNETESDKKMEVPKNVVITLRNDDQSSLIARNIARCIDMFCSVVTTDCGKTFSFKNTNRKEDIDELFAKMRNKPNFLFEYDKEEEINIFTNIGILSTEEGADVAKEIAKNISDSSAMVFVGTKQEIENFANRNPSIMKWIPECNYLSESPVTREDVIVYFLKNISQQKMRLSPECLDRLCKMLTESYSRGIISSWSISEMRLFVCNDLKQRYLRRLLSELSGGKTSVDECPVEVEDINEERLLSSSHSLDKALAEINSMTGLGDIKRNIQTLTNRMQFLSKRKALGLKGCEQGVFHAVFTGNPGTGKTTVAKLLGKIYHSLGILSKGDVITVDRTSIIGHYIGGTEENMKHILEEARGNVLFVDEAYTLAKADEKSGDFGIRAIECLLTVLAEKNPDMVVIFAGYEKEMEQLMASNTGLSGRFPYHFHFPDYNTEELVEIAKRIIDGNDYTLTEDALKNLRGNIVKVMENHGEDFSNARWVEQFIHNWIIPAMADRLTAGVHSYSPDTYKTIEAVDIDHAFSQYTNSKAKTEMPRRRVVGFNVA